jgi:hypothetical protein
VILRILTQAPADSEVWFKRYEGLKFLGIWKLFLHWKRMDRVYRPIDHGKAWLTVNQSPWPAGEAHWSSAYSCSERRWFTGTAWGGRGGAGDSIWALTRARGAVERPGGGGEKWQHVELGGIMMEMRRGELVAKMDAGGVAKDFGVLYRPGTVSRVDGAEELRRQRVCCLRL